MRSQFCKRLFSLSCSRIQTTTTRQAEAYRTQGRLTQQLQLLIDQLPNLPDVSFSRADVSDRQSKREFIVELRMREQSFSGCVHSVHDRFVQNIQTFCTNLFCFAFTLRTRAEANQRKRS